MSGEEEESKVKPLLCQWEAISGENETLQCRSAKMSGEEEESKKKHSGEKETIKFPAAKMIGEEEESKKKHNKVKLLLCLAEHHIVDGQTSYRLTYNWYSIDPNSEVDSNPESPLRLHPILPEMLCDHRSDFGTCIIGSKIYVVGGLRLDDWPDKKENVEAQKKCTTPEKVYEWDSGWPNNDDTSRRLAELHALYLDAEHRLYAEPNDQEEEEDEEDEEPRFYAKPILFDDILVCDFNSSSREWNKAGSMQSPRSHPQVIPIDGKIFIFGSSFHALFPKAHPWAEVFDPTKGTCKRLDDPPIVPELGHLHRETLPNPCLSLKYLTFHDKNIALKISSSPSAPENFYFDTQTSLWEQDSVPPLFHESCDFSRYVIVDQVLYAFTREGLLFCKLDQKDLIVHPISGLKQFTRTIQFGLDYTPYFFFHLGDQDFFLVWSIPNCDGPGDNELLCTLKFHLSQKEQPQDWIAVVDTCNFYLAAGIELIACLKM